MYIPKSRIKPNLYTSGGEYMVLATSIEYVGYYHSLYTGEFFTGKTQNDVNVRKLVPITPPDRDWETPYTLPQRYINLVLFYF